jgi:hypothetical protein
MNWAGHVARMGTMINTHKILVGKLERKRPLAIQRHRWDDNIKVRIKEIGWIHVAQDRAHWRIFVNMVMNLHIP